MTVNLIVEPTQPPLSWDKFIHTKEPYAIALDGYVHGAPQFVRSADGPWANFNHHEDVDRLSTRATCGQVLIAIRQGLFQTFRDSTGIKANVYVNDCDEDVCTAWFLLKHPEMAENSTNPLLNRLVDIEDKLDCTAGAYPIHKDTLLLQEMAWIYDPYRKFRMNGGLDRRDPAEFKQVIENVCLRIMAHLVGRGSSIPLDFRYDVIDHGKNWTMVREIGSSARTAMVSNGIGAFISVRDSVDGKWIYSIGRVSQFIDFDVPTILRALNEEEKGKVFGGGNTIGGCREGSTLNPETVVRVVKTVTGE